MPLDHLRLRHPVRIDAVERIEDEIGVIAHRARAANYRIEHAEIFGGNKAQFAGLLRPPDPRCGQRGDARARGFKDVTSEHVSLPALLLGGDYESDRLDR